MRPVALKVDFGSLSQTVKAQVMLPSPNRIELAASCVEPRRVQPDLGGRGVQLQPYPNRVTRFEFQLSNHSDEAKNLKVELLAVPAPPSLARPGDEDGPPGLLLKRRDYEPTSLAARLQAAHVVAIGEMPDLPPNGKPAPLVLHAQAGRRTPSRKPNPKRARRQPPLRPSRRKRFPSPTAWPFAS